MTQAKEPIGLIQGEAARYSTVAIVLHWLIALALAFELALGFAMPKGPQGFALWQLHKSAGITILVLTLLRLGWRLFRKPPASVEGGLAGALARAVHIGFYAFMLLAPLTGWAMVSTSQTRIPTLLYGLVPFPDLPLAEGLNGTAEQAHQALAWLGLGLIALHVVGVVRHELLLRHGALGRISPAGRPVLGAVLGAIAILAGSATFLLIARQPHEDSAKIAAVTAGSSVALPELEEKAAEPDALPSAEANPPELPAWSIRPGGRLSFSVANGGDAIEGRFAHWGGTVRFDPERPAAAEILIEIDLASATVGDATQDQMLVGDEYFSAAAHPKALLRISSARRTGTDRFVAQGTLELKGASRPQTITFRLSGSERRRHVAGNASVARAPFDIGMGATGTSLSPTAKVSFSFDAEMASPAD